MVLADRVWNNGWGREPLLLQLQLGLEHPNDGGGPRLLLAIGGRSYAARDRHGCRTIAILDRHRVSERSACLRPSCAVYKSTGRVLIRLGQPSAPEDIGAVFEARCQERDDPGEVALGRGFRSRESELGPFVPVEQRGVARPAVGVGPAAVARGPALDELSALLALALASGSSDAAAAIARPAAGALGAAAFIAAAAGAAYVSSRRPG